LVENILKRDGTYKDFLSFKIEVAVKQALKSLNHYKILRLNGKTLILIKKRIKKRIEFIRDINQQTLNIIAKNIMKIIIAQLLLFITASHFIDTHFIDINTLKQTTYYKTITSRP
jgi:hypothetical protein